MAVTIGEIQVETLPAPAQKPAAQQPEKKCCLRREMTQIAERDLRLRAD